MRRYNIKVGQHEYTIDVQEMSADRFHVWVGDQELDVEIAGDEDIAEATITPEITPQRGVDEPIERPKTIYRPPAPDMLPPLPGSGPSTAHVYFDGAVLDVIAPMPGTILNIKVAPGDKVTRGQVLLILEAMKMKNSIKSPYDGAIAEVLAVPGQHVSAGTILLRFSPGIA